MVLNSEPCRLGRLDESARRLSGGPSADVSMDPNSDERSDWLVTQVLPHEGALRSWLRRRASWHRAEALAAEPRNDSLATIGIGIRGMSGAPSNPADPAVALLNRSRIDARHG